MIVTLADAVAAHINGGSYGQPVNARRLFQPAFTLAELQELRVSVVPRTVMIAAAGRDSSQYDCFVDVGVQKKVGDGGEDEIVPLLDLVEQIADRLRGQRLGEAAWAGMAHEPVVASEALEQHRVFTSVLSVTYRVRR